MATSTKNTKFSTRAAKQPKDHQAAEDTIFEIETSEGTLRVPKLKLPAHYLLDGETQESQIMTILVKENADETATEILGKLDGLGEESEFVEVMDIWQKASGIDMGESSASPK